MRHLRGVSAICGACAWVSEDEASVECCMRAYICWVVFETTFGSLSPLHSLALSTACTRAACTGCESGWRPSLSLRSVRPPSPCPALSLSLALTLAPTSASSCAVAGYSPTPHEKQAYAHLFSQADKDQLGVLTGDTAVPFFSHSALPALILGEVWQLADPDNAGFLSPDRFGVACRLIGHAQDRQKRGAAEVRPEWVAQPGPLPTFKGYPLPASIHQPTPPTSPRPAPPAAARQSSLPPASPTANNTSASLSHISPHDKAKYARVFANANGGNVTGQLDGDKARDIWVKSQLPYDVLGQIWSVARFLPFLSSRLFLAADPSCALSGTSPTRTRAARST